MRCIFFGFLMLSCCQLSAQARLALAISPNALEKEDARFVVTVGHIAVGETFHWQVYRDCTGNGKANRGIRGSCKGLVLEGDATATKTPHELLLKVADLRKQDPTLDDLAGLWFTAYRKLPSIEDHWLQFGLSGKKPCPWLQEIFSMFLPGKDCGPAVGSSLRTRLMDDPTQIHITFQVRTLQPNGDRDPKPLAGTDGASGIAWLDRKHLLMTVNETLKTYTDAPPPGLYSMPLAGGPPQPLWTPPEGERYDFSAPLALPKKTQVFVRRSLRQPQPGEAAPVSQLVFIRKGKIQQTLTLPTPVYRMLAWDADSQALLGLTLGQDTEQPAFFTIQRQTGRTITRPYAEPLYRALMQHPKNGTTVITRYDVSGRYFRHLLGFGKDGVMFPLVLRKEHDQMPLWNDRGNTIYYLAEIGRIEPF